MQYITSVNNPLIKKTHSLQQKKYRQQSGLFLIEGPKGVEEAIRDGLKLEDVFVLEQQSFSWLDGCGVAINSVSESVMRKISATDSVPAVVAVAYQSKSSLKQMFAENTPLIVVLEDIRDPGNLGTIIRTAIASEASGIVLTGDSVDVYNPKVVRSTAANLWKIPIISMQKEYLKEEINAYIKCNFIATVVNDEKKPKVFYNLDFSQPSVIMFGSEAQGISQDLIEQTDTLTTIPMSEKVESLNLSISVGVMLYEAYRQRNFRI